MSETILIAYATKHGSTRQVADAIAAALEESGASAEIRPLGAVGDPGEYAAVVLGGPMYMGRWHRDARAFLRTYRRVLARVPFAVFATGPVTEKPEDWQVARDQLDKAIVAVPELRPVDVRVFGGSVDPARLHFPFSRMPAADLRDWNAIRAWGAALPKMLGLRTARAVAR